MAVVDTVVVDKVVVVRGVGVVVLGVVSLASLTGAAVVVSFMVCRANDNRLVIDRFKRGRATTNKRAIRNVLNVTNCTYSTGKMRSGSLRCSLHLKPSPTVQSRRHSTSSPTPEVHEPSGSIWRELEVVDNFHTVVGRGNSLEPRKGSKVDKADIAWASLPEAMSGSIDCFPVAFAARVLPH